MTSFLVQLSRWACGELWRVRIHDFSVESVRDTCISSGFNLIVAGLLGGHNNY